VTSAAHRAIGGSQRFRRQDRIRVSRDYARVRAEGRRATSRHFAVEAAVGSERSRLGLVVSRRVGNAVARNRTKRLVREWFRRYRARVHTPVDIVVIARSGAGQLEAEVVWRELADVAERVAR
jgi:ribonuclease P protein component